MRSNRNIQFVGNWDRIQDILDAESISEDLLRKTPEVNTFDRFFRNMLFLVLFKLEFGNRGKGIRVGLHVSLQLGLGNEGLHVRNRTQTHFRASFHCTLEWPLILMNTLHVVRQVPSPRKRLIASLVSAHECLFVLHHTISPNPHYGAPEYAASVRCAWRTSYRTPDACTGTPTSHAPETPTCGFRVWIQ